MDPGTNEFKILVWDIMRRNHPGISDDELEATWEDYSMNIRVHWDWEDPEECLMCGA